MSAEQKGERNTGVSEEQFATIDLLAYLEALLKRKALIFWTTFVAALVSLVTSLLLPKIYTATARILPPQQEQNFASAIMGQLGGGLGSLAGGVLGKGGMADTYVGMLRTETIKDAIIDRFRLMEVYKKKYREDAYRALDQHVAISSGLKDGIITISVDDKDPKRAAAMANAFVDDLAKMTIQLSSGGAGENRAFLEKRLAGAKADLAKAAEDLKTFQANTKALDVPEQAKAALTEVATLKGRAAAQEVRLAGLRRAFTDSSQEVRNAQTLLESLRAQVIQLQGKGGDAIPGLGSVPALGQEYVRRMRDFKIQETLVEFLTKQYEAAKLGESKDISSMQVLQTARIPDRKSKPKRSFIVVMGTMLGLFFSMTLATVQGVYDRMGAEEKMRWKGIRESLFPRFRDPA